jgi:hypothetical protein
MSKSLPTRTIDLPRCEVCRSKRLHLYWSIWTEGKDPSDMSYEDTSRVAHFQCLKCDHRQRIIWA